LSSLVGKILFILFYLQIVGSV